MADPHAATGPASPRVSSGSRGTGDKTLGNYSGGYRQFVATQAEGEAFFCIVALHSITTPIVSCYILAATGSFNGALLFVGANALVAAFAYLVVVGKIERVVLKRSS